MSIYNIGVNSVVSFIILLPNMFDRKREEKIGPVGEAEDFITMKRLIPVVIIFFWSKGSNVTSLHRTLTLNAESNHLY